MQRLLNAIDHRWHGLNSHVVTYNRGKVTIPQPACHFPTSLYSAHLTGTHGSSLLKTTHLAQCFSDAKPDEEDITCAKREALRGGDCLQIFNPNAETGEFIVFYSLKLRVTFEVDKYTSPGHTAALVPVCFQR